LKARTGVARDNLSQDKIKEFEIFIPPIEEQREIVSKIEKLEEKINQLEKGISLIPSLKEAVLEKYL
jgi:restriction endonuclease S subunit